MFDCILVANVQVINMLLMLLCLLSIYKASSLRYVSNLEKETFDLNNAKNIFDEFIKKFGKHYDTEEEYYRRLEIFKNNLEDINNRNKNFSTEVYGITKFLDKTVEEFNRDYNTLKLTPDLEDLYEYPDFDDLVPLIRHHHHNHVPDSWDWRDQGVVTPAADQGDCSSCWAFSAVGCVESQYAIKHGTLYTLSEQQLVDCFGDGGDCETGRDPHEAFDAAARMGGLMKQKYYHYKGKQGRCRLKKRKIAVEVNRGRLMKIHTEKQLKKLVYEYGPVSIGIVVARGFGQYNGGIATPKGLGCARKKHTNHAVLLVGYGTENGVPYWIIKNSHGEDWGEEGFMRLIRGKNACSILEYVATADVP